MGQSVSTVSALPSGGPSTRHSEAKHQPAATSHHKDPFRFFDLPRELQDHVYSYTLTGEAISEEGLIHRDMALVAPQLVSRQFRAEYLEVIREQSTWIVGWVPKHNPKMDHCIEKVHAVEVHIRLRCEATPTGDNTNRHPEPGLVQADDDSSSDSSYTCGAFREAEMWAKKFQDAKDVKQ